MATFVFTSPPGPKTLILGPSVFVVLSLILSHTSSLMLISFVKVLVLLILLLLPAHADRKGSYGFISSELLFEITV